MPEENAELKLLSPFPVFQEALKTSVRAALIMYVMFYGFKIVMNGQYADLNNIAAFVLKFLFITYFAVGLGPVFFRDGKETTRHGMVEFGLLLLSQIAPDLAVIVFGAGVEVRKDYVNLTLLNINKDIILCCLGCSRLQDRLLSRYELMYDTARF